MFDVLAADAGQQNWNGSRRASLRNVIKDGMPAVEKATAKYDLDEYYDKALSLVISGRAREAFDLSKESAETKAMYGTNTFGQSCLLARRLVEAGTRFVEINWPKVANSDNHSFDVHAGLSTRMKNQAGPLLDAGLSGLIADTTSAACSTIRWWWPSANSAEAQSVA